MQLALIRRGNHMSLPRHSGAPFAFPFLAVPAGTIRSRLWMSQEEVRDGRGAKIRRKDRGTAGPTDDTRMPGR